MHRALASLVLSAGLAVVTSLAVSAASNKQVGLGARLMFDDESQLPVIVGVMKRSAADKAKLRAGDFILSVDGKPAKSRALPDVIAWIKGPKGTRGRLTIRSQGEDKERVIEFKRRDYKIGPPKRSDIKRLEKFGEDGVLWAQYALGLHYYHGQGGKVDYKRGLAYLLKVADAGNSVAQTYVADAYLYGRGTKKDSVEGVRWLKLAEMGGNLQAKFKLGALYLHGEGVVQNYAKAVELLTAAAELDVVRAQSTLGKVYEDGAAVDRDLVRAYGWHAKAAAKGFKESQEALKRIRPKLTRDQLAEAQRLAAAKDTPFLRMYRKQLKEREAKKALGASRVPEPPADVRPKYRLPEKAEDFAVVIGVSKYQSLPPAEFAEKDAGLVAEHMGALGVPRRNIIHLSGPKAGYTSIKKYIEAWLPRNVKPSSRVFFYFSGHGAPDIDSGEAYLVPWDGDPSFLDETAYPVKRLYANLGGLKAKRVIVALDACFSGAGGRSVLAKGARPLVMKVKTAAPKGNITLLTAASGNQITTTLQERGHGMFTYFLLDGLNGAAKDEKGRVTAKSLFEYLRPRVQDEARRQNREQTPTLRTRSDILIRAR